MKTTNQLTWNTDKLTSNNNAFNFCYSTDILVDLVKTPFPSVSAVGGDTPRAERMEPLVPSSVGSFAMWAGNTQRKYLLRSMTNALPAVDEVGTLDWSAILSRPIDLSTTSE